MMEKIITHFKKKSTENIKKKTRASLGFCTNILMTCTVL